MICLAACVNEKESQVRIQSQPDSPLVEFGIQEIQSALSQKQIESLSLELIRDEKLNKQGYTITRKGNSDFLISGGAAVGIMYGALELAELIRISDNPSEIKETSGTPFIRRRGLKFNIPLDARTPGYDDTGDSAQKNILEMWSIDFWHEFLDEMTRYRYNALTLWNPHPFPSMIKLKDFPDVALDDIHVCTLDLGYKGKSYGDRFQTSAIVFDNLRIAKKISIEEKIAFWKEVMAYAQSRGIDIFFITWNIRMNSVAPPGSYFGQQNVKGNEVGKYGINNDQNNPNTIKYLRACVKELFLTYPDLAGLGFTAGENMVDRNDEYDREKWLWQTYGLGILDAKKVQPDREIEIIHRAWLGNMDKMMNDFADKYPDGFATSFKYARARLYSSTNPPFSDEYQETLKKYELQSWWNLRNEDIFHFRWGDPEYVRDFIRNLPPESLTAGYHMGSDGYVWARETISKNPKQPRDLEINKHWFSFLLWGRLAYDNELPEERFVALINDKFPTADSKLLYDSWKNASKIIPLVTRFHWNSWDYAFTVDGCMEFKKGFHTVQDFITCPTMPGSGMLTIPEYVNRTIKGEPISGVTPVEVAERLLRCSETVLKNLEKLRAEDTRDQELSETINDIEAVSHLGKYYAHKIQGAVSLQFHLTKSPQLYPKSAASCLEEALVDWKNYASAATKNYNPQVLARIGFVDWEELIKNVEGDLQMVKNLTAQLF